ncbi:MAG: hypothetical protein HFJ23_07645 [Clostridia bacterium]|nr:hypothetical protein [Clostridia bacterium]
MIQHHGYLDSVEIQVMMSLLKIIDNPMDDIALVTVLRSMIGGFSDNELIQIRIGNTQKSFYETMCEYIKYKEADTELKKKIEFFLDKIDGFRKEEEYMPLNEFIWKIYLDTGYYSYVSLMPNGILRASNLKILFEKAKEYEKTSFKGLYNFISFIDKLKLSNGDMSGAKLIGENENVIRIMSIHKSKGLEFPVVFLSGTAKGFNMMDLNQNVVLLHQDLGLGMKYINYDEGESYNTLSREAIKVKSKLELLSEEMRILYVALTRAKEKLILTGTSNDYQKSISQKEELLGLYKNDNGKISKNIVQKYKSYLDWIELVYLQKEEMKRIVNLYIHKKNDVLKNVKDREEIEEFDLEEKLSKIKLEHIDELKEKLEWEYGHKILRNALTKSSVTKIKAMKQEEADNITDYHIPEFISGEKKISSTEKGTLMHLVLQKLDEKIEYDEAMIEKLIKGLCDKNIISEKEAEAIDIKKIYAFTKSTIWDEMKCAKEVHKEKPFYINLPAKDIYEVDIDENVLVQGVIDLYYITESGEIVLVDYKTDRVKEAEELVDKYSEQLRIYKMALEKSLGKKVTYVYIYSVYLEESVEL